MRNHSLWLAAFGLAVSFFWLPGCSPNFDDSTAPPYDFVRDDGLPDLPFTGPIDPVVVSPPDAAGFTAGDAVVRRDAGRRLEGPLSEEEIRRLQTEAEDAPFSSWIQTASGGLSLAPILGVAFESLDFVTAGSNFVPPDPELAVGPNHTIAVVNDYLQIFDRFGTPLLPPVRFATFFAGVTGCANLFDPNVLYDEQLDRFVVGIDANATGYCIAMTQGPDPLLAWNAYGFSTVPAGPPGTRDFFDYPHAGIGEHAVFMGANVFNNTATTFLRAEVWAIDKNAMAAGLPLPMPLMQTVVNGFTPQPMNAHGWAQGTWPIGQPHTIVANSYIHGPTPVYSGDIFDVWAWSDPFGANLFGLVGFVDLAVATGVTATYPIDAPQFAAGNIQANDWRILDCEYRNGDVWMTHTISCNPGMGTVDCVRWAEIDPMTPSVRQAGVFASDDEFRIFPDTAVNHCDDLTIGYTKTSTMMVPAVWVTGRLGTDPPGLLQAEALLRAGDIPYVPFDPPPHRWGDYTGGTPDPDGVRTWYLGEYSKNLPPPANWGTFAGEYSTSCGVDLAVGKTDGMTQVVPGSPVTYTITVSNLGRGDALGAVITDSFPAALTGVTWTCAGQSGPPTSSCSSPAGSGNINLAADLQVGSSVTIVATGTVDPSATGTLVNTASAIPVGIVDPAPGNNSSTDTDLLVPTADLEVHVTDGSCYVLPGASLSYTVTVNNNGPSNAPAASVGDTVPADLTVNSWTCSATGSAVCGAASGTGPLGDTPSLPAGDGVVYTVSATVSGSASGVLVYTVGVSPGAGVTDPVAANNSHSDVNALELPMFCDDFEDGTTDAWSSVVP
jgi:uncharacterized repeat protein (TIGR01451 family)